MSPSRLKTAAAVVTDTLERYDPQLPGAAVRARLVVEALYECGLLAIGRPVARVDVPSGVV